MSTTEPSFEEYDFDHGNRVCVDWADGDGPLDEVVGTVSDISRSGGDVIREQAQYHAVHGVDTRRHLGENLRSTTL